MSRRVGGLTIGVALAASLCLANAGAAKAVAVQESSSLGSVQALMEYDVSPDGVFTGVRVRILRNGVPALDQFPQPICEFCSVGPGYGGREGSVHVLQLDPSPEPEVVFDLYTGGAHCCFYSLIFRYVSGAYVGVMQDWLDQGYRFSDLDGDGLLEFSSDDGRFAYVFASFAGSQFPPQIWQFRGGLMLDVTSRFPAVVGQDAAQMRRMYKRAKGRRSVRAILAALVADQCLLGSCSSGFRLVKQALPRGYLDRTEGKTDANGKKFVQHLRSFLRSTGYLTGA
jgi:hypothetical protein